MKSNLDSLFKTDEKSEKNGIWFSITDETGFLVKRMSENNPAVKATMAKFHKPYAAQIERGTLPFEKEREILTKVFVHASLQDWRGVVIDGQDVPFSKEKAFDLLMDLPDLFATLFKEAQNFDNYKADVGNS